MLCEPNRSTENLAYFCHQLGTPGQLRQAPIASRVCRSPLRASPRSFISFSRAPQSFFDPNILPSLCPPLDPDRLPIMNQRELDQNVKALTKSVQANEPSENTLRLLETLKKDAQPTEEMLRVRDSRSPVTQEESCVLHSSTFGITQLATGPNLNVRREHLLTL